MNLTKVKKAIVDAQEQINGLTDASYKARKLNVVRTLDLAFKALERADKHLDVAKEQNDKKDEAPAAAATDTAATAGAQA